MEKKKTQNERSFGHSFLLFLPSIHSFIHPSIHSWIQCFTSFFFHFCFRTMNGKVYLEKSSFPWTTIHLNGLAIFFFCPVLFSCTSSAGATTKKKIINFSVFSSFLRLCLFAVIIFLLFSIPFPSVFLLLSSSSTNSQSWEGKTKMVFFLLFLFLFLFIPFLFFFFFFISSIKLAN